MFYIAKDLYDGDCFDDPLDLEMEKERDEYLEENSYEKEENGKEILYIKKDVEELGEDSWYSSALSPEFSDGPSGFYALKFEKGSKCNFINCLAYSDVEKLYIPKSVVDVGIFTCAGSTSIEEVIFEEGINLLTLGGFQNSSLKKLVIPASVENLLLFWSFEPGGKSDIEEIEFEEGSKCEEIHGFFDCVNLKKIKFPKSVKKISGFCGCTSLEEVEFEKGSQCEEIEGFNNCPELKKFKIPLKLKGIPMFYESMKNLTFEFEEGREKSDIDKFFHTVKEFLKDLEGIDKNDILEYGFFPIEAYFG